MFKEGRLRLDAWNQPGDHVNDFGAKLGVGRSPGIRRIRGDRVAKGCGQARFARVEPDASQGAGFPDGGSQAICKWLQFQPKVWRWCADGGRASDRQGS